MICEQTIQKTKYSKVAWHRPRCFCVLLFTCIIAILLGSLSIWYAISRQPVMASVYVNGVEVAGKDAFISRSTIDAQGLFQYLKLDLGMAFNHGFPDESAKVPLLSVWEAMGAEITWVSDDIVEILFEENQFTLTLSDKTMYFTNSEQYDPNLNVLVSPPGNSTGSCDYLEKDLLIDQTILHMVFWVQGKSIDISWDKQDRQIMIIRSEE